MCEEQDLYDLLDVLPDSSIKQIKSAYRKKALTCHPDKNPNNPKAAEKFQQLQKALDILLDETSRSVYDRELRAKKEAKLRLQKLDAQKRKLKEEFEEREIKAKLRKEAVKAEKKYQEELIRLANKNRQFIEEELRKKNKEEIDRLRDININKNYQNLPEIHLKIKWNAKKNDPSNGGYNQENLEKMFSNYGSMTLLVMSKKKNGSAIVEYSNQTAAYMAQRFEKGLDINPLLVEFVKDPNTNHSNSYPSTSPLFPSTTSNSNISSSNSFSNNNKNERINRDFESLEERKIRQAEERQRLIEQIKKQETNEDDE